MGYCYSNLLKDSNKLVNTYPFVDMFSIGESVMEKKILCLKIGTGEKKLFINGSHHGLEYLTSAFIMRFLDRLSLAFRDKEH
ncbi:MAG: peptidase M14, partial [Clostridia bacterium]|nr:peptidase M14 [Clostridia bacterium]